MTAYIATPTRFCEHCEAPIARGCRDGASRYSRRRFCGHQCADDHSVGRPGQRGPRTYSHHKHTNPLIARAARELYFVGKLKQREIARMFNVRQGTVSRYVSGRVWSDPR